jgi:hypothetical protein
LITDHAKALSISENELISQAAQQHREQKEIHDKEIEDLKAKLAE